MNRQACKFERVDDVTVRCAVCGRIVRTSSKRGPQAICWPDGKPRRLTPKSPPPVVSPPDLSCIYRGELLRVQQCDLCGLRTQQVEVLACAVHGECSLHRRHSKVTGCLGCPDRQSSRS